MDVITPNRDLTQMESKGHWGKNMNTGKLSEMVNYGPPVPASSSMLGSRPGFSMQQSGKLNPRWVETLMGLPVGWTMPSCASPVTIERMSSDYSVTVLSQQRQNKPSGL
jgi:hypothetical protein